MNDCEHNIHQLNVAENTTPYAIRCDACQEDIAQGVNQMLCELLKAVKAALSKAELDLMHAEDRIETLSGEIADLRWDLDRPSQI